MSSQTLSPEHARLGLSPGLGPPPPIVPPTPAECGERTPGRQARHAGRRSWLAGLTGGVLGPAARPEPVRRDPLVTLVQRITFGARPDELEHARALGFEAYLEEQLAPFALDDSAMEAELTRFPAAALSPKELVEQYPDSNLDAYRQTKVALLARATSSRRQLLERMVEFWNDHFSIDHNKGIVWALLPEHERTVIRPHALGTFPELLSACAFSGAMLYYLDNWLNVRSAPQNNYARELLELHTLSVHGGYTNADVDEVARCFTGWTLNGDPGSPDHLRGTFDPALHARGTKFVLGHVIGDAPPVGRPGQPVARNEAQEVLDILARHPSTAAFLAGKLVRRFLTPAPPPELVQQVAETYLATGGDIPAMLRVILTRRNLAAHSPVLAPLYRRPFHLAVALFRAMEASHRSASNATLGHLVAMGHSPYDHVAPDGYPHGFEAWGASLLPRWIFAATYLRHDFIFAGVRSIGAAALSQRLGFAGPADVPGLARRMNERFFGLGLSPADEAILQGYLDAYPAALDVTALYDGLVLGAKLPSYQWF